MIAASAEESELRARLAIASSAAPDDYFSWCVVFLPLLTGMAATGGSFSPATAWPLYPLPLAIHLLSVELLFLWLPFGKLAHAFLVFATRGITGAALARKGAAL